MVKTTTNYIFPKEYFKYVNRFLKEVGLYPHWIKFLYASDHLKGDYFNGRHTNWQDEQRKDYTVVDVLGSTNFTDFLGEICDIRFPNDICTFELFEAWLSYYYPQFIKEPEGDIDQARELLMMDKEKKMTKLLYEKY